MKKYFYESVLVCVALVLTAAILVYLVVSANHVETVSAVVSTGTSGDASSQIVSTEEMSVISTTATTIEKDTMAAGKINVNTATVEELKTLKGIGDVLAQNIIDYRRTYGPFTKPEDLLEVSGIGEVKLENIRDSICFS